MPLADRDRGQWDTVLIAEGVDIAQAALLREQLGEYQAQAAIAVLHADAARVEETDWVQIVEWYDKLLRFADKSLPHDRRQPGDVQAGDGDGVVLDRHVERCLVSKLD